MPSSGLSIGGTKSFEPGGEFNSSGSDNTIVRYLGNYAGTLLVGGATFAMAGYALVGKGSKVSRGAALTGALLGSLLTLGLFDDESCTSLYPRDQRR